MGRSQREINASVVALQNGLLSLNKLTANYGRDVEELFSQIQSDKEMAGVTAKNCI